MVIRDDNFYTIDANERDWCLREGGFTEGKTVCYVLDKSIRSDLIDELAFAGQPNNMRNQSQQPTPLYRLWQNDAGDHFFTTFAQGKDDAIKQWGFQDQGVACYVFSSSLKGYPNDMHNIENALGVPYNSLVPLHQLYQAGTNHHILAVTDEVKDGVIRQWGFEWKGLEGYVIRPDIGPIPYKEKFLIKDLYRLYHP
jgi:hypothetical protein